MESSPRVTEISRVSFKNSESYSENISINDYCEIQETINNLKSNSMFSKNQKQNAHQIEYQVRVIRHNL